MIFESGSEFDRDERQPPDLRDLDELRHVLGIMQDKAVDQRALDGAGRRLFILPRNRHKGGAQFVASLGHAGHEGAEISMLEGNYDGRTNDANGVDPATHQEPPLRVGTGIAQLARRRLDPGPHLGTDLFWSVEGV